VLDDRVAARQAVFERYRAGLPAAQVEWMPLAGFGRCTRWLSAGTLSASVAGGCEGLIAGLAAERIEARRIWKPLHLQPLFAGTAYYRHPGTNSVADDLFARGFCLPSGSNMTTAQQDRVIEVIRNQLPV
jgi:pyridoxal phosphate-dependent aminotransferase EpsN